MKKKKKKQFLFMHTLLLEIYFKGSLVHSCVLYEINSNVKWNLGDVSIKYQFCIKSETLHLTGAFKILIPSSDITLFSDPDIV